MENEETPRIQPLEPPYSEEAGELLGKMMPANSPVEPLKLFRTMARNEQMAAAMTTMGSYVLGRRFSVERREREIVIDRVCARCGCEYEWGVHVASWAERVGVSEEQVAASVAGAADLAWSDTDRLLIRLVDELHETSKVSGGLWQDLERHWSPEQLLDLLLLAGWYHAICYVANGAQVAREEWAARFPNAAATPGEASG